MGISFVVVDKENALNLKNFTKFCEKVAADYEIIYCSSKPVKNNKIINYVVESTENTEKIINATISKATQDILVVIRDVNFYEKSEDLIKKYTKTDQIICLKRTQSKFKQHWFNFVCATIARAFSHNLAPIDHSVVLYGEIATKVLKQVKSPSVLMRTNKWNGINFEFCQSETTGYKFSYKKDKFIWGTCTTLTAAIMLLILQIAVLKMNIIASVFYFALIMLLTFASFIFASKLILNSYLGDNITERAEICLNDANKNNN